MAGSDRTLRVSERVYRALLAAYPKEFRDAYGSQMEQTFRDLCRDELRRGGMGVLVRLWARTGLDLATTAVAERRSARVEGKEVPMNDYKMAGIGFALLLAPLFFVAASLLKYGMGVGFLFDPLDAFLSDPRRQHVFNLVSPVVFLGGLGLALALNAYAVVRLNVGREDGMIVGTVRLEAKFWNIVVAGASFLLLVTLVGYFFAENFVYRP
jgi:hypothetical protein